MEERLKDFYGKTIGYIRTEANGNKTLYDFHRKKIGTYDKRANVTRDFYGRIIYRGDQLTSLLGRDN